MEAKKWYQSKTIIVNGLVVLAALLTYFVAPDFPVKLDDQTVAVAAAVLGGVNIVLRFVTTQPVGK